ncbi:glucose-6-phosphate isomerase [Catellatospora sp. KI3]|uniref:glucose-6-phosphate isomerase n=1 Tax=Catellatospora sp. KI3 TaxID=3041620 RepID=UPI002482434E|nr:glucose-6-phosphate isomerase [Catellatospora sp. KI3]MDI1465469.1 glucose-6-phosphate isomerase [Catellatospora sp. KI3]
MTEVATGGGLTVRLSPAAAQQAAAQVSELEAAGVPAALAGKDATLWGPDAQSEAIIRLGWIDTFVGSRALLPQLAELREELGDLNHVVLAGMGGSSLAPEVISLTLGKALTVLDTTDPGQVKAALGDRLDRTVVVVSSKSGGTIETDSHRRAYWQAFLDAGLPEAEVGRHFVIVTDPGSPLESTAREMGAYVVLADPNVGGRYSALTAFGLVPTALAGVDVAELLDQAEEFAATLAAAPEANPSLLLGAALGAAALAGRDKVSLADDGSGITGLGDWAEQLIAESTGKDGKGILPVVVEGQDAPGATGADVFTATVGAAGGSPAGTPDAAVNGPLGAQFLCWEAATAIAGRVLGINPFDQPNVTESKQNTGKILDEGMPSEQPAFTEGDVAVYTTATVSTLDEALAWLVAEAGSDGYIAIMEYLDRFGDADGAKLRAALAQASGRPVTYGWGPRFLHSTGQYHKGGPQVGAFLQVTGAVNADLAVPGKPYSFGTLQAAQAAGDRQALAGRGRPLLHLHLTDRAKGTAQLLESAHRLSTDKER